MKILTKIILLVAGIQISLISQELKIIEGNASFVFFKHATLSYKILPELENRVYIHSLCFDKDENKTARFIKVHNQLVDSLSELIPSRKNRITSFKSLGVSLYINLNNYQIEHVVVLHYEKSISSEQENIISDLLKKAFQIKVESLHDIVNECRNIKEFEWIRWNVPLIKNNKVKYMVSP